MDTSAVLVVSFAGHHLDIALLQDWRRPVFSSVHCCCTLTHIVQGLRESRGGRPGLSGLASLVVFRGRKAILNHAHALVSACP